MSVILCDMLSKLATGPLIPRPNPSRSAIRTLKRRHILGVPPLFRITRSAQQLVEVVEVYDKFDVGQCRLESGQHGEDAKDRFDSFPVVLVPKGGHPPRNVGCLVDDLEVRIPLYLEGIASAARFEI